LDAPANFARMVLVYILADLAALQIFGDAGVIIRLFSIKVVRLVI
jgi:hypothetical protein